MSQLSVIDPLIIDATADSLTLLDRDLSGLSLRSNTDQYIVNVNAINFSKDKNRIRTCTLQFNVPVQTAPY